MQNIEEMTQSEVDIVCGGAIPAVFTGLGHIGTYIWILDQAWAFGEGLGSGFYDATH